jgi:hypothetical protein
MAKREPVYPLQARWPTLRHAWLTFGKGGPGGSASSAFGMFDAARGVPGKTNVFGTGPAHYQCVTSVGPVLRFNVTGSGTVDSARLPVGDSNGSGSPGGNVMTLMCLFNLADATVNQALYGANTNGVEWRINSTGKQEFLKSGVVLIGTSTTAITTGVWQTCGVTYDGTNAAFYLNGLQDGTASSAQTFTHSQQYEIGGRNQTGGPGGAGDQFAQSGSDSYMSLLSVFDSVLTPSVIQSLSKNPWQLFTQKKKKIYKAAAALTGPVPICTFMMP